MKNKILRKIIFNVGIVIIFCGCIGCSAGDEQNETKKIYYESTDVGDIITFGTYEQDNNVSNGKEPIEWKVLDKKDGKLLLISRYVLDCHKYEEDEKKSYVVWKNCTLRTWLNKDFLDMAFSTQEQSKIPLTTLSNPDNTTYGTEGGGDTVDRVFVLSSNEVQQYFADEGSRMTSPTPYAKAQGAYSQNGYCYWLLRSPGMRQNYVKYIHFYGSELNICAYNMDVVRPAIWLETE